MKPQLDLFQPRDPQADALGALIAAVVLTALGIVCVYSFGAQHVVRHGAWALLGVVACIVVSRVPLARLRALALPALVVVGALLLFALLFSPRIAGTKRWLVIPALGVVQPSELAKLAVVLFLADRMARKKAGDRGRIQSAWPVAVICTLVVLAPDFGTAIFIACVSLGMLVIAGARLGRVVTVVAFAAPLLLLLASQYSYVQKRLAFFRGEMNYQQEQALLALGNGGFWGTGLGAGRQKMSYLPAGHTDFVFPNVGEELGFLGVGVIALLFGVILVHGLRVALAARRRNEFGFYLACGATLVVVFQAVVNIAVATGAAPTKGISLPFLSQGGSNLFASLLAIGLVVNVGRRKGARQ